MRNFYVGLDFEYNSLAIGLNKDNQDAMIFAEKTKRTPKDKIDDDTNPNRNGNGTNGKASGGNAGTIIFVLVFIIIVVIVAIACYVKSKR